MNFRRATTIAQQEDTPRVPVRLARWWRGYQQGQVACFKESTAAELRRKGWAIPYKPTREEKEDDERRVQIQRDGIQQERRLRDSVMQGLAEPSSPKRARA